MRNFHVDKLKACLIDRFGDQLQFWKTASRSELVFKPDIEVGAAVEMAFESASSGKKMFTTVAKSTRRYILQCQKDCSTLPWPPSAEFLQSDVHAPPAVFSDFIELIVSGKKKKTGANASDKTDRIASSIAEDICAATSNGVWKMPKHMLLGISAHHLTGSTQIVTLLNRFGHCCSYTTLLGQRGAMEHGTLYRLVELVPVRRTLFTPPSQPQARTPDNNVSIEWQQPPMPTREEFEEMQQMFGVIMEFLIMFNEKFMLLK